MRATGADANEKARGGRRGGRPSRAEAERLGERILDTATEAFLREGYGGTSIEAIAKRARISKRTFYSRFEDKAALFGAVVHRVVERLRPADPVGMFEGGSLEEVLLRLARYILRAALTPQALALHRVILAEATRFPELAAVVTEQGGGREAVQRIATLLERERTRGGIGVTDTVFAATQFLQMVVGAPQRRALGMGPPLTEAEIDSWAAGAVSLFLNGCRT
ncbi:MAG TPA: TetR/AcrR family transcriptional regulator [Stellaceae bacterium]|nr:TetR/AcrR family transcriptional regulator [Stellaceae bacterium]